jgi:hypothetical protein
MAADRYSPPPSDLMALGTVLPVTGSVTALLYSVTRSGISWHFVDASIRRPCSPLDDRSTMLDKTVILVRLDTAPARVLIM